MAGKRIEMKNVHSIVLMLSQGYGTKHISASLGCARNTVKAYRAIIASKGVSYEELLSSPEEELERFFVSKELEISYRLNIVLIIHVVRKDILPYAACPYLILP